MRTGIEAAAIYEAIPEGGNAVSKAYYNIVRTAASVYLLAELRNKLTGDEYPSKASPAARGALWDRLMLSEKVNKRDFVAIEALYVNEMQSSLKDLSHL